MFSSNRKFDSQTFELSKFHSTSEVGALLKIGRKCKYKRKRIKNPVTRRPSFGSTRNRNPAVRTGAPHDFPNAERFPRDKPALTSVVYCKGKPARVQPFADRPDTVFSPATGNFANSKRPPNRFGSFADFFFVYLLANKGLPAQRFSRGQRYKAEDGPDKRRCKHPEALIRLPRSVIEVR